MRNRVSKARKKGRDSCAVIVRSTIRGLSYATVTYMQKAYLSLI